MTSASRMEPPGWMAAVAPASAAAIKPSANGKNASLHTTEFCSGNFASPAFQTAMRLESTRLICPAPMPSVRPAPQYTMAFDFTCFTMRQPKSMA